MADLDAAYFDSWYDHMTASPTQAEIQQSALGLPPRLESSSALGWDGIAEGIELLALDPGQRLLELACGRGGYGIEIAARTGATLKSGWTSRP